MGRGPEGIIRDWVADSIPRLDFEPVQPVPPIKGSVYFDHVKGQTWVADGVSWTLTESAIRDPHEMPWRTGGKVGRTIYAQFGDQPSDEDRLIGMMDTRALATEAVDAHNQLLDTHP